jgi:hypothetical protein
MIRVWKFFNQIPITMAYAIDYNRAVDMAQHPEKYNLPPGNYYVGPIVERQKLLGHNLKLGEAE